MSQKIRTSAPATKRAAPRASNNRSPACGCWINIFDPLVGELVGLCGYDYALIDMEHSPVTTESVLPVIRAVQSSGSKALVRVPDKQPRWIGRLMDMGADGVMVPMVNTASEAHQLADSAIYAPAGTRGMAAGIVRASGYGVSTDDYLENYRKDFMLMIQIESQEALSNVDDIAAVDGVDCVFIGPFDLAGSLGNCAQPDHKDTRAAIRSIMSAATRNKKLLSTLITPRQGARKLLNAGFDIVFSGMDVAMLKEALQKDASQCRALISQMKPN